MRIGYAYPFKVWPPDGGNKIHAYQLIKRFREAGHHVVTVEDDSMSGLLPSADPDSFLRLSDIVYVRVDAYPLSKLPFPLAVLRSASVPIVIELNAPANEMLAFSWLGGSDEGTSLLPAPLVSAKRTLHAARVMLGVRKEDRLRRTLASRWDVTICVSSAVEAYARKTLGVGKAIVLPNGSDPEELSPDIPPAELNVPEGHLVVLFAGSPKYPWQGLRLLGHLISDSWHENLPITFLMIGHQAPEVIPQLPNVRVVSGVQYSDMASYINAADVCVSLQPEFFWSPWGFHGSPMKFFDYLACGKPVVASDVGQLREIVLAYDCGVLCQYEVRDLKEKLLKLASDRPLRLRLGANGRRAVESTFNWDAITRTTLATFEALVAR